MITRISRPAVLAVVGHVDHGKTTLLDAIRRSELAKHEPGRITQKVGAYCIDHSNERLILLDTPGHQAFSITRDLGIGIADVVVLVVALDSPVPIDCKKIISKACALKKSVVVCLNKTDKAPSNIGLATSILKSFMPRGKARKDSDWIVPVSAANGDGVSQLLQAANKAYTRRTVPVGVPAQGIIIDVSVGSRSGILSTLLVRLGTLGLGNVLVINGCYARVKALSDDSGRTLRSADPTIVPMVLGLTAMPNQNDRFLVVENEHKAKEILVGRLRFLGKTETADRLDITRIFEDKNWTLGCFIVKAQTAGMSEAVNRLLAEFSKTNDIELKVISRSVGNVSRGDVKLASITKAKLIAYGTTPEPGLLKLISRSGICLRCYNIIYDIASDLEQDLRILRQHSAGPVVVAVAKVKRIFGKSANEAILGCEVTEGTLKERQQAKVFRDAKEIASCEVKALKRFKERVAEVNQGEECGVAIKLRQDVVFCCGDILQVQEQRSTTNGR